MKVAASESQKRLMFALGEAVRLHCQNSPMTVQEIVGVLAFTAGAAIIRGTDVRSARRDLREVAVANVDQGMGTMRREAGEAMSNLILPAGLH